MEHLLLRSKCSIFHNVLKKSYISKASKGACVEYFDCSGKPVNLIWISLSAASVEHLHRSLIGQLQEIVVR